MQPNVQSLTGQGGQYQEQAQPFTDQHNQVYNNLRNLMLTYNASGVPGMDKLLNTLNKTHTEVAQNYMPNDPNSPFNPRSNNRITANIYNPNPGMTQAPLAPVTPQLVNQLYGNPNPNVQSTPGNLQQLMRSIQADNTPRQMPNGSQIYGGNVGIGGNIGNQSLWNYMQNQPNRPNSLTLV